MVWEPDEFWQLMFDLLWRMPSAPAPVQTDFQETWPGVGPITTVQ